jgi:hypothetical protein
MLTSAIARPRAAASLVLPCRETGEIDEPSDSPEQPPSAMMQLSRNLTMLDLFCQSTIFLIHL